MILLPRFGHWVAETVFVLPVCRVPAAPRKPGTFIAANVGRDIFDELNLVQGGENFGWPYFEGPQRFRLGGDDLTLTPPTIAYPHPATRSVIGGAVL